MIISHKHGFVFASAPKTGSSSAHAMIVESGILGDEDIVSPYTLDSYKAVAPSKNWPTVTEYRLRKISPYIIPPVAFKLSERGDHSVSTYLTPTEALRLGIIDYSVLDDYQFITVKRDPVDQFISSWGMRRSIVGMSIDREAFKQDIANALVIYADYNCRRAKHCDYTSVNGVELLNVSTIEFNHLTEGVRNLVEACGGVLKRELRLKSKYRKNLPSNYHAWLTDYEVARIRKFLT